MWFIERPARRGKRRTSSRSCDRRHVRWTVLGANVNLGKQLDLAVASGVESLRVAVNWSDMQPYASAAEVADRRPIAVPDRGRRADAVLRSGPDRRRGRETRAHAAPRGRIRAALGRLDPGNLGSRTEVDRSLCGVPDRAGQPLRPTRDLLVHPPRAPRRSDPDVADLERAASSRLLDRAAVRVELRAAAARRLTRLSRRPIRARRSCSRASPTTPGGIWRTSTAFPGASGCLTSSRSTHTRSNPRASSRSSSGPRAVMTAFGDSRKPILATEITWPSSLHKAPPQFGVSVTEAQQAPAPGSGPTAARVQPGETRTDGLRLVHVDGR